MTIEFCRPDRCIPEILADAQTLCEHRQSVHQEPDLGFDTNRTIAKIVKRLNEAGITDIDTETVPGAAFALIAGTRPGRTIALRADIDALGMDDKCGCPWQSTTDGRAHACGHDGHQAWLVGAGRYLARHRDFPGRVLLIFQPAEEIAKGADAIVNAGILEKYDVAEIYGMHDEPNLPAGEFGFRPEYLQASSDYFYIDLHGKGGHGGRPHLTLDPMPAAAEIILSLQSIVARRINPMYNAVVSVCAIAAGKYEQPNVIPSEVKISGTIRTFRAEDRALIHELIAEKAQNIAAAEGIKVDVRFQACCLAVYNDPALTEAAANSAKALVGEQAVHTPIEAFMSSEDFSAYQQKVPGVMVRCGVRDEAHQQSVHHPAFDFNDRVLPLASSFLVKTVLDRLNA